MKAGGRADCLLLDTRKVVSRLLGVRKGTLTLHSGRVIEIKVACSDVKDRWHLMNLSL